MGKLKGPRFDDSCDFEMWKKLIKNWLRTLPTDTTNESIVAAIVLGLSEPGSKKGAIDIVLEIDEKLLYPKADIAAEITAANADTSFGSDVPGLNRLIKVLQDKYGLTEEERVFKCYEEFESLKRGSNMTVNDYVTLFETAYRKLESCGVTLNGVILVYRLCSSWRR